MEKVTTKECQVCREDKPLDQFSKNSKAKDLKQAACKACNKKTNAKFRNKRPAYQNNYYNTEKGRANKIKALNKMWDSEGAGIYRIRNKVTGTVYIGSTTQYARRRFEWASYLNNPKDHRRYFSDRMYNDAMKYGREVFEWEKIEPMTGSKQKIVDREYEIIKLLHKIGVDIYNVQGVIIYKDI